MKTIPKRECSICGQEWATTYEPTIGPVCQGCKGHCASAEAILTDGTGMCPPPHYDALWWRIMAKRGEVISTNTL